MKYFDLKEILTYHAQYYMIFGQRSNGKSFSVARYCIDEYFKNGKEFVICKRFEDDMKQKIIATMLSDHDEYVLEEYGHRIKFYRGQWLVYPSDSEGKLADCSVLAHAMSISSCDRHKGAQYPKVGSVIFEEFMSMNSNYLNNEVNLFINLISTIVRNREGVKIFMLGNAIARVSPYTKALGVRLDRMTHGSITCREFSDGQGSSTTFAIQRCPNVKVVKGLEAKKRPSYSVFGRASTGAMIRDGEFETGVFNKHCLNYTLRANLSTVEPSTHGFYTLIEDVAYDPHIYIVFEEFIYEALIVSEYNTVVGFIEVDEIDNSGWAVVINSMQYIPNVINMVNFNAMDWSKGYYEQLTRKVLQAVMQDKFVVESNEDGQNIVEALVQCGLTELRNRC